MGWGSHMGDWGAGWWILMTLLMVAFWGLVIVGIVWLVRSAAVGHRGGGTAIEVLDHRLAGGEISPEEYRRSRDTLTDGSTPDSPDSSREGERGP
ncbi:MAG: SHOCT domain-containing protein [Actinobacteria bacterium]|nr:SHOCT domain-containing protein [Actinomycetota bacterium]